MNTLGFASGSGFADRFFWDFSYKNRKKIIPVLLMAIFALGIYLLYTFFSMEMKLRYLARLEPVYVLSLKRDINAGDLISVRDLKVSLVYKKEYENLHYLESKTGLKKPSLIKVQYDEKTKKIIQLDKKYINRVATVPILEGSLLREEFLAVPGTLPGLMSLIPENHSLVNIEVPKIGFNTFLQANDRIDIYDISSGQAYLVVPDVKIIIIDSKTSPGTDSGLPNAGMDLNKNRYLTLAIPNSSITRVLQVNKSKNLFISYRHPTSDLNIRPPIIKTKSVPAQARLQKGFQSLTLIQGEQKQELKG